MGETITGDSLGNMSVGSSEKLSRIYILIHLQKWGASLAKRED